jgi:uncharacterized protein DUF4440
LEELNRHYIRSVAQSDVGWFREHLSGDFMNSNPNGSLVDRAGFLAQFAKPAAIANLQCEDVRIRVTGAVAIIPARTTYGKRTACLERGGGTRISGRRGDAGGCASRLTSRAVDLQ